MISNTTLLQIGMNAIGRWFATPPSGSLLRKAATLLCAALAVNTAAEAQSTTFNFTGSSQTYTATSTGTLLLDMAGARGGGFLSVGGTYGNGGRVVCTLAVTSGQVLNIYVGGVGETAVSQVSFTTGGFNGGGNGSGWSGSCCYVGGGGGGATDIRIGGTALADRVVVAGGGGGAGWGGGGSAGNGGGGGGLTGGASNCCTGGSQSFGGGGGAYSGSLGTGASVTNLDGYCGGGGGGYYGGGANSSYSGGSGGSSYTHATLATGVTHTQGYNSGNGYVIITPLSSANTLDLAGLSSSAPAKVAYSLRRLSSSYTGNLIQVRRSSDNATSNIGYDGSGNLDVAALTSFVGSGNGYISIWYDQSGNGNNAVQATTGSQPKIVNAGTVVMSNSRPVVAFDGYTFIDGGTTSYGITGQRTMSAVYEHKSGAMWSIIDRNMPGNPVYTIIGDNMVQVRNDAGILVSGGASRSLPFQTTTTFSWNTSNNINSYTKGVADYSGSLAQPSTMDIMRIGRHYNSIIGAAELNIWEVIPMTGEGLRIS